MPIAITKQKVKPVEEPVQELVASETLSDESLADKYGELKTQVEALMRNPVFAAFSEVEKELFKRLKEDLEPTDSAELVGSKWKLEIAPCNKNPRRINQDLMPQLAKDLGLELFYKLAKLTMKDMEQYLGKMVIEKYLETNTGYSETRKIKIERVG